MKKVALYSFLLILGLIDSQLLAGHGELIINFGTMLCLSYIMIHVGLEFDIDKSRPMQYAWDYLIAGTAATFPWLFCAGYFMWVLDMNSWREALLLARFSSPTSAGILFSMLAAAGLAGTWVFRKARVLAIFDDLDTILLMIPLKIMMIGMKWQLMVVLFIIILLLWAAWRYLHEWHLPIRWNWILFYAALITCACEIIHLTSGIVDEVATIDLEVLLPSFVLGCMLAKPKHHSEHSNERVETTIAALFMLLVGLSMPPVTIEGSDWSTLTLHVLLITLLSNLGKMFPYFCYRDEATRRERLALSIGMFPRGEVGAGVLVVSIGYGLGGIPVSVAVLSLALNLLLTGVFIMCVKKLLQFPLKIKD